jgi:CHAT domain-containing protein
MRGVGLTMALATVVLLAGLQRGTAQDREGMNEALALHRQAKALEKANRLQEAAKVREKMVEKLKKVLGPDHETTVDEMNNLAMFYAALGQYARAAPLLERSLSFREAKRGKNHLDVAAAVYNLAMVYREMGQYARAERLYLRSLAIYEAKQGRDHTDVASILNGLAGLYSDMGQTTKAIRLQKRCLAIREARLGKDHPDLAESLQNLALLHHTLEQYASAEPLYLRALKIMEDRRGKGHLDVASILNNLGTLSHDMGQYEKAEPLYLRSLKIKEAALGKDAADVARSLNNLALLYQDMGRHASAEPLFRRSLAIWESKVGKDHPTLGTALNNLGKFCAATGDTRRAASLFDRARRGARHHVATVLPALPEAERADFFRNTEARSGMEWALSLGLAHRDNEDLAARSATWLLNGKALDQESLASSVLLTQQSSDPALKQLAARLGAVRQRLARLALATPASGQEKQHLAQIEELTTQEQALGKQLRQSGSKAAAPAWIDLADVQRALPAEAVLIDIALFRTYDFKAPSGKPWQKAHYAAWVTPQAGPVRLVDLGQADKIDQAIQKVRVAMQGAGKRIQADGEESAEKSLRAHLEALSNLVLTPLLPHVGKAKRWLVSPDGNLWLVPFEALTLKGGAYAVEKHQLSYLISGRDLLPGAAAKVKPAAPLVLADPDFDLDPARASASAPRPSRKAPEGGTRALSGGLSLGRVLRLRGTAAEARAIAPSLERYAGVAPRVRTGERALEGVVKAARSPRVLVLSTHGFFLPDQAGPPHEKGKPEAARKWENPLLRCGLLLAGCNNAAKATTGDDGVLTGLEVVGTDLRGTELVVLSACETGLGEVQKGEGVSGLRQAFQLAGAQAVVSTLWQVPDKQSARLMALFFENLSKGMSKAEALRAAKLKLIEERREDFASAHPFFWAAFTLTGQP